MEAKRTRADISRLTGKRGWYQYIELGEGVSTKRVGHEKSRRRTTPFVKWVEKYVGKDDVVLDLGCNAGLYSIVAGLQCKRVYGVEIERHYVDQAEWVKKQHTEQHGTNLDHVTFHTLNINKRLELLNDITFLIASKVLYHKHFKAGLPAFMKATVASPIKQILAQGHTVRGRLGITKGMLALFRQYGFQSKFLEDVREYPIVYAWRDNA